MRTDTGVVLAAGGSGSRFGERKQFLELGGRPLIHYSLDVFSSLEAVTWIVLVVPEDSVATGQQIVDSWSRGSDGEGDVAASVRRPETAVVAGGGRRQDSVLLGLRFLSEQRPPVQYVLVHDAARPLLGRLAAEAVLDQIRAVGAAVIGTPLTDSIQRIAESLVVEALPRKELWAVQTPQGARLESLVDAYTRGAGTEYTDEASALQAMGYSVAAVKGPSSNVKITHPSDLALAEWLLERSRGG